MLLPLFHTHQWPEKYEWKLNFIYRRILYTSTRSKKACHQATKSITMPIDSQETISWVEDFSIILHAEKIKQRFTSNTRNTRSISSILILDNLINNLFFCCMRRWQKISIQFSIFFKQIIIFHEWNRFLFLELTSAFALSKFRSVS